MNRGLTEMKFEDVLPAMRAGKIARDPDGDPVRMRDGELEWLGPLSINPTMWCPYHHANCTVTRDGWSIVEERKPLHYETTIVANDKGHFTTTMEAPLAPPGTRAVLRIDELPAQKDPESPPAREGADGVDVRAETPAGGGLEGAGTFLPTDPEGEAAIDALIAKRTAELKCTPMRRVDPERERLRDAVIEAARALTGGDGMVPWGGYERICNAAVDLDNYERKVKP